MGARITNFQGNPNIGLYGFATDKYCLIGHGVPDLEIKYIKDILKVPVHQTTLAGTSLVGVFASGNEDCLLVPDIIQKQEKILLEKVKINFKIIKAKLTAFGNNIACNGNGLMINPEYSEETQAQIEKALDLKAHRERIAGLPTVGSCIAMNKNGILLHSDASAQDIKTVKDILKLEPETGTLNMGNPFIRSSILCNSNGYIVGSFSGGPEIQNAETALGFAKKW